MAQTRYHITFKDKRTTISVDKILSDMMAVKLKRTPETEEAHTAVREWLQETLINHLGDQSGGRPSRFAQIYLIKEIADKRLLNKYEDWASPI